MVVLADLILVLHFVFVLFVVSGFPLIWIGAARDWLWVRNFWFRVAHLAASCFVAAESMIGMICPLTVWEDTLRSAGRSEASFIQRWVSRLLYYDLPESIFAVSYVGYALFVVATFWLVKPARR
ncbi:MAG: DUF2784 domain-containing protein [Nitrospira sp.]